jgi:hypothetical protein
MRPGFAILVFATSVSCTPSIDPSVATAPVAPGIATDVAYLSSPELDGRATGTAGGDSAAVYIARQYEHLRLPGIIRAVCNAPPECPMTYFQFFKIDGSIGQNIVVLIPGSDSSLRNQYVVVGAHYDHLGHSPRGSLDPEAGSALRPGADDNASGTAALLELARRLAAHPLRRSVLIVHFDAEELGLVGSGVFVDHSPVPRQSIILMVNFDMVGRMRDRQLIADVASTSDAMRTLVDSAANAVGLHVRFSSMTDGRTDDARFKRIGIQTVSLFTGFHADYHRATDVASRINVPGIERVVDVAEGVVRATANKAGKLRN